MNDFIEINGAHIHNLKHITVRIPRNRLTVITGVSGSGKSSLAFDTIYEEGKRRYLLFSGAHFQVETRSYFERITGLSPTVAVEQRVIRQSNPRSTVGTRTKIGNMLSVLFATSGQRDPAYDDGVPLSMEMFQKNSPKGMCVKCLGSGRYHALDQEAVIRPEIAIKDLFNGFIVNHRFYRKTFQTFCTLHQIDLHCPIGSLSPELQILFKYGCQQSGFVGAAAVLDWLQKHALNRFAHHHAELAEFDWLGIHFAVTACPKCQGTGLGEQAVHTTIGGHTITDLENMAIRDLVAFLRQQRPTGSGRTLLDEMLVKLECLDDVGLHHLSLARPVPTLSGGEIQRLFLAACIIADMEAIIFIFDEPTIGLHEAEKAKLIDIIRRLVQRGNTVIAVEHDANFMQAADYIVDLGPEAGAFGGERIYQGSYQEFLDCRASRTAPYLAGTESLAVKNTYKAVETQRVLTIAHAHIHNLHDVTVTIPLGLLVGVAGVSGSGKSSLVHDTLVPKLKERLQNKLVYDSDEDDLADATVTLQGWDQIKCCIVVDQQPIGRSKTSCPASYTRIFERIRKLFAHTPEALAQGYTAGLFTVNSHGGCPACKGEGTIRHYLGFGNFLDLDCEACAGAGFVAEALQIHLDGKTILDVLNMSVTEAAGFFNRPDSPAFDQGICVMLHTLERVGLGYITLGQKTPTISGGEAQRIKLARELAKQSGRNVVYILDEPTTGLAFADTQRLIALMQQLVDAGNTVIVTEHDPAVLANCDYVIEMGPGGGHDGGCVIATGTPHDLRGNPQSIIGRYLKR